MPDSVQPFVTDSAPVEEEDVVELSDWISGVPDVDCSSNYMYKILQSGVGVHYIVVSKDSLLAAGLTLADVNMSD